MPALAHNAPLTDIHADVWHAHALATARVQVQATGDAALDAQLPGGGWPVGAMTEVLQPPGVYSEWRLLLPALARCGQGPVVMVGAPQVPFAPALAAQGLQAQRLLWITAQGASQRLWATEQALRCAEVDAVLVWLSASRGNPVRSDQLRRLQMAASEHSKLLFVMRPDSAQTDASPALLRVQVAPAAEKGGDVALQVHILKRRGPLQEQPLYLQARSAHMTLLLAAQRYGSFERNALDRTAARAA
jgi:protein ImuA